MNDREQMKADVAAVDFALRMFGNESLRPIWQRLRARLEALEAMAERLDREVVAKAVAEKLLSANKIPPTQFAALDGETKKACRLIADATIAAIKGETP